MVKSPPELWAELSEVEGLERHLGEFGEITITRAEPETAVAWEGENASGTVELEPTGWGTKVTITAEVAEAPPEPETDPGSESTVDSRKSTELAPEREPVSVEPERTPVAAEPDPGPFDPEPDPFDPEPVPEPKRRGFLARWMFRERRAVPAHPAHTLNEFPEDPAPQLPEWSAQEPQPEADPEPVTPPEPTADVLSPTADDEFEFEFAIRRGDEQAEAEDVTLEPLAPERAKEVLETALENLGQAHHRPFSRG